MNIWESFKNEKEAFGSKGMKINLGKTIMMVSGAEGEIPKSNIDPSGIIMWKESNGYLVIHKM